MCREFKNDTRGSGIMNHRFHSWAPHRGPLEIPRKGVMVSSAAGDCTPFALQNLEERGQLFVAPSVKVYCGMIVGEHSRDTDLDVNPAKAKHLTNVRSVIKDDFVKLAPPRPITLETAMSYIQEDELIEVTPTTIRLRKKVLDPGRRRTEERRGKKE
jgi:GTP-binding protein